MAPRTRTGLGRDLPARHRAGRAEKVALVVGRRRGPSRPPTPGCRRPGRLHRAAEGVAQGVVVVLTRDAVAGATPAAIQALRARLGLRIGCGPGRPVRLIVGEEVARHRAGHVAAQTVGMDTHSGIATIFGPVAHLHRAYVFVGFRGGKGGDH